MKESDDNAKFLRFRTKGDVRALGDVFDALAPELLGVARHLVAKVGEAEDLVQATFLTAIEKSHEFDEERAVAPWMIGILAGHAANLRRKRARVVDEVREPVERAESGPSESAERRELMTALRGALAGLPATYRDVLEPFLHEGSKPREIAAQLGITPNAARVRVHRGLEMLRNALPAGFAAGAAVSFVGGRALADVRRCVLSEATQHVERVAVTAKTTSWLGGAVAAQRAILGLVAVVAIALTIGLWSSSPGAPELRDGVAARDAARPSRIAPTAVLRDAPTETAEAAGGARTAAASDSTHYLGRVSNFVSPNGAAIEGARVWTTPAGASGRVLRAVSDAAGRFEFDAPRGEDQTLFVEADGYAAQRIPISPERRASFWADSGRIERDGGALVELFEIRLRPGAELFGRVEDRTGHGVGGAELVLCEVSGDLLHTFEEHSVGRSVADGAIRFDGLLPKSIADDGRHWILFAVHSSGVGWTRVAAPTGRQRIDDVLIVLDQGLPIDVVLRDLAGKPIDGAVVTCMPMHDPFPTLTGLQQDLLPLAPVLAALHTATSGVDGIAHVPNAVRAKSASPGAVSCRFVIQVSLDGRVLHRAHHYVRCDPPARVTLKLARLPAPIPVRGHVVDLDGRPIADAQVVIRETAGADLIATSSAHDGSFETQIAPDAPDLLDVVASMPGFVTDAKSYDRGTEEAIPNDVELVLGPSLSIAGRVVDEDGRPIADVSVYADGGERWTAELGEEATSDASGRFVIRDVVPGSYSLGVVLDVQGEYEQRESAVAEAGARDALVVLHRRSEPTARVELDVVDELSGELLDPVGAALLAVDRRMSNYMAPRFASGLVSFEEVKPGRYVAWVSVPGRATTHVDVEVAETDRFVRVGAPIGDLGSIVGRVDLSAVAKASQVWVRAQIETDCASIPGGPEFGGGGNLSSSVAAARDGAFELPSLAPGRWRLTVEALGLVCAPVEVELTSGSVARADLRAAATCVLELRIEHALDHGWILAELTDDTGAWTPQPSYWNGALAAAHPISLNLTPGVRRWRLRFVGTPSQDATDDFLAPAEGEVNARAGEVVRLVVPLRER